MSIQSIHPYVNFDGDATAAIELYTSALGAEVSEVMKWSDLPADEGEAASNEENAGRIMHAKLTVAGQTLMLADVPKGMPLVKGGNSNVMVALGAPADVDRIFAHLSEGGDVGMGPHDSFWGARFAMFSDRFGVRWMLHAELPEQG